MENTETIKVLVINSGTTPIHTEKYEFASNDSTAKEQILAALNRLGKATHALIKYKGKLWIADHTSQGNTPSTEYYKSEIKYHPFARDL